MKMNNISPEIKKWVTPKLYLLNINNTNSDCNATGKLLPGNDGTLDISNTPCGS